MRTLILRRTLQALLLPALIFLVYEWATSPKHSHLEYLGNTTVLTLVLLFLGPWWIDRPKRKDALLEMPRHPGMAVLIYGLFLVTGIPIVSIWAVLWAGFSVYSGALLAIHGDLLKGFVSALVPLLGVLGLYTLWALARFYVRVPRENPPKRELIRQGIGLAAGVGAVIFIWTVGDIWNWGALGFSFVALSCLPPIIVTLFFLLLMLLNWIYPPPTNSSPDTDAPKRRLAQR